MPAVGSIIAASMYDKRDLSILINKRISTHAARCNGVSSIAGGRRPARGTRYSVRARGPWRNIPHDDVASCRRMASIWYSRGRSSGAQRSDAAARHVLLPSPDNGIFIISSAMSIFVIGDAASVAFRRNIEGNFRSR